MAAPQGVAFFPGLETVESATYTRSHGISPSFCTIQLSPQRDFTAAGGTLIFQFGSVTLTFPNCRVDQQSLQRDPESGEVWALSVFDRRWKWSFAGMNGPLSGHYNWLADDARPEVAHKKRPQELARLCLDAMGERNYDVSQMPNDFYPEVDWDQVEPAHALADLCQRCGCRIVLTLADTVRICRTGFGRNLPIDDTVISNSLTINPPERPDALRAICPAWYEADFVLEAVGEDVDGSIKPIDKLSYKPATGWEKEALGFFFGVPIGDARALAKKTVFRWYRMRVDVNPDGSKPFKLPGYAGKVEKLQQLLPNLWGQTETVEDNQKVLHELPAEVFGTFFVGGIVGVNSQPRTPYKRPFQLDANTGIVKFENYVVKFVNQQPAAATLYLRVSAQVRDLKTWAMVRYARDLVYPGDHWNTGPRLVRADDQYAWYRPEYDKVTYALKKVTTNRETLDKELDLRLRAVDLEYQTPLPQEVAYDGLRALDLDGAIQQVTWSVSMTDGATTRASRNDEFSSVVPTHEERRVMERLRADANNKIKEEAEGRRNAKVAQGLIPVGGK